MNTEYPVVAKIGNRRINMSHISHIEERESVFLMRRDNGLIYECYECPKDKTFTGLVATIYFSGYEEYGLRLYGEEAERFLLKYDRVFEIPIPTQEELPE